MRILSRRPLSQPIAATQNGRTSSAAPLIFIEMRAAGFLVLRQVEHQIHGVATCMASAMARTQQASEHPPLCSP
jgi:hypothetical protein